jgi:replicative DNA helicase
MDVTIITSPESERELLSYVLVHNSLDVAEKYEIQEEDFSVSDYKTLFKVFKTLNNQGKRIDLLEVSNFLTTNSVKLVAEPKALIASILDSAYYNPESAASIVKDKSLRRRIMSAC